MTIYALVPIVTVLLVGLLLIPLVYCWSRVGLAKAASAGRCEQCSYDLAGLPSNAPCPECGSTVRPTVRRLIDAPAWITKAWLAGSLVATAPIYIALIVRNSVKLPVVLASIAYAIVLLICFRTIARRPNKSSVVVAMSITLGAQVLTQVFQVLQLDQAPATDRSGDRLFSLVPLQSILISAAALATISIAEMIIIALTPDIDLTPPASPAPHPAPSHPQTHPPDACSARSSGGC